MAKQFAPRVAKKERDTIDLSEKLSRDLLSLTQSALYKGARVEELNLKEISVKDQVRTKFNDDSIRDLAKNIQENGLIQPLVVHYKNGKYTLICGERRYRAMSSINTKKAPCFIIENKTQDELMAIQFSENSSREALHYIDKADGILNYQNATDASERKIVDALGISKSDVHRSLQIARLPHEVKEAAKKFDIEKYVLLEWTEIEDEALGETALSAILKGKIVKRQELQDFIKANSSSKKIVSKKSSRSELLSKDLTKNDLMKALNQKTKGLKLDKKTKDLLKNIVKDLNN